MDLFVKNARYFWGGGDEPLKENVSILIKGSKISAVGTAESLAKSAVNAKTVSGENLIVIPGLVNTHHHFYQTLTRNLPVVQNAELFEWLVNLYPIWANFTPDDFHLSTTIAALELLESGCTTSVDHSYLVPHEQSQIYSRQIEAATRAGLRFHLCRGSMSRSKKDGGLPPDTVVQKEDVILKETDELVSAFHQPGDGGMVRIVVAPCSPFSVTPELMMESKKYADSKGLLTHTHLAETKDEEDYCLKVYGCRPFELMEKYNWMDTNSFFAHSIHFSEAEVERMGRVKSGVAHCPTSNMRLGSGIAPIVEMNKAGVKVGLAVDGSASNDCSNMMLEVRQSLLLQRVLKGAKVISAVDSLKMGTIGGARVLGRNDIGFLKEGYEADLVGFPLNRLRQAGSISDPLAALVFCSADKVDLSIVHGELLINRGKFTRFSEEEIEELMVKQNERSLKLSKML
ncbi:MAG: 8-oxoguanine deaminase [Candidatus Riflebacteria bacterium]|nr:8-oxoguanine deaminase [Candidatus Riflebacteria bacterium]